MTVDIGTVGIWHFSPAVLPYGQSREIAQELEELGYGAIWIPEAMTKDPFTQSAILLEATERIVLATGIANIYGRDAMAMSGAQKTLTESFPDRFLLGLGVSHQVMVEGMRGHDYSKPLTTMRNYLEAMTNAMYAGAEPSTEPATVIGALGPKMLALAAEATEGAHPYNVTPEHTASAREILGPDKLLAPEQAVVFATDADAGREAARDHLAFYLDLPNYTNNLRRYGFDDSDFADGGSDRLVDRLVPSGDVDSCMAIVQEHRDAGADHVALQVFEPGAEVPRTAWRELAAALIGS